MNLSRQMIDLIVQNVLRELKSRSAETHMVAPTAAAAAASAAEVLRIDQTVITEATLQQAGAAGKTVAVSATAVITPSGRDFIRREQVRLASQSGVASSCGQPASGTVVVIGETGAGTSAASLVVAAKASGWRIAAAASEAEAASEIQQIAVHSPVICSGGEPSLVACLVNRNADFCAAVVSRSTDLFRLRSVMNPVVYCIDPAGWSFAETRRLMTLSCTVETARLREKVTAGGSR